MEFKGIYKSDGHHEEVVIVSKDRNAVVEALLRKADGNYCLDSMEERRNALSVRNFCMLGCGPGELLIEEIE